MSVQLESGKVLLIDGKVANHTDCCCCCHREVTEISFITVSGSFNTTLVNEEDPCSSSCSFSKTWNRISSDIDFSDEYQFKLSTHSCLMSISFPISSQLHGGCSNDEETISAGIATNRVFFDNDTNKLLVSLFGSVTGCILAACAVSFNDLRDFTLCDASSIIGSTTYSNDCSGDPWTAHIEVTVEIG